jgi:hypothetical protein
MAGTRSRGTQEERPSLLERTFSAGCTRIAVASLHRGAGARTVLECVATEFHARGIPLGVTRAPRVPLDGEDERAQVEGLVLPEGTIVATTASLAEGETPLERIESLDAHTTTGEVALYRVARPGNVLVYGPDDPTSMTRVVERLEARSGGLVLVDGAWERRGFAAPAVTQGVVLVVGVSYSVTPRNSAAAVHELVEMLRLPPCSETLRHAWDEVAARGRPAVIDRAGRTTLWLDSDRADPLPYLTELADEVGAIVMPDRLRNDFVAPLCRSPLRFTLVVRDPTDIDVAPVHWAAWTKRGGIIRPVESMQVLAVATNPVNPSGPDADADEFRRLVAEAIPDVPVHDVRLEAAERERNARGRWWRRRRQPT